MHSNIFQIDAYFIEREDWANEDRIADFDGHIDGADYWDELSREMRVNCIKNFFTDCFPEGTFRIIVNNPDETAVVEFCGNIHELYEMWKKQIQDASNALTVEGMGELDVYRVLKACEKPFDLSSKFYQENWNGCTTSAAEFLDYLRHLDKQNDGEPFEFYVGQVFDYHF